MGIIINHYKDPFETTRMTDHGKEEGFIRGSAVPSLPTWGWLDRVAYFHHGSNRTISIPKATMYGIFTYISYTRS